MIRTSKVALAMIIRGNEDPAVLDRCLATIAPHVDGVFITVTTPIDPRNEEILAVLNKYGVFYDEKPFEFHREVNQEVYDWLRASFGYEPNVQVGDKIFQFDKARNHNFSRVREEYEWILWLDVDDVFRGGAKIHQLLTTAEQNKAESVFLNYIYQCTVKDGKIDSILIQHLRERFVRNNGVYKWVAPIHETLIEQRPTTKIQATDCDVVHLSFDERMRSAIGRNMKTLEMSIFDTEARDPRPIYYLAKAYFDLKGEENLKKALGLMKIYLKGSKEYEGNNKSGWAEERSQCWEYVAEIYRLLGQTDLAIKACHEALIEDCKFPSIYLNLGLSYILKNEWDKALHYVKLALATPQPATTLVINPRDLEARALEITYFGSIQLNKLDDAYEAAHKLAEMFPESQEMINRVRFTTQLRDQRELTRHTLTLANYLKASGEGEKLKPLLAATPSLIVNNPFITDLYRQVFPPRKWDNNEIAIMCGPGFTNWSPRLLENPENSFMGGSEEAVVYLSKELAKQGWKVTVYADPGNDEGEYDGVTYVPYYKFNQFDEFNVLVSWRNPKMVDNDYSVKKMYLWAHDLLNPLDFTEERVAKFTKIIVLSPYHRSNIPNVPDEKILISSNGIPL